MLTESCDSAKEVVSESKTINQTTLSGTFEINEIDSSPAISKGLSITFEPKSNSVSGFSGCNSFFGTYTLEGDKITLNNIGASKKFCGKKINTIERQLISALNKATHITIEEGTLTLLNEKVSLIKASKTDISPKQKMVGEHYNTSSVTYKAIGRGNFNHIEISKDKIIVSTDRNLKEVSEYVYNKSEWSVIEKMINNTNLSNLSMLIAPTDKRLFDGAAIASLTIRKGDVVATSSSFDHGHPPKEIEDLVNKVLSIKENSTKD
jgi:heat shock protein HslJ